MAMTDEIKTGISRALDSELNGGQNTYAIYGEPVEQDLKEPCFLIQTADVIRTPLLGNREHRSYNFDVIFIPGNGTNAEMLSMADELITVLKWITLRDGGRLLGFDMRYEITDGVLHFFVSYPVVMSGADTAVPMIEYGFIQNTT